MRSICLVILCALLLPAAVYASFRMQASTDPKAVVQAFVDALNSKDQKTILDYAKAHWSDQMQARAPRLVSFSQMGAPFSIVEVSGDSTNIEAKLQDSNSAPISLKLALNKDGQVTMAMVRIGDDAPAKDYSGWTDLSRLEDSIRSDTDSPAMSIAVLHDGNVESAASGVREIGKADVVSADEPFSIGSIGKSLCSTIIGKLIEDGKLRWDETLAEALPNTPMKDGYRGVTIEEILHHRGGIPEDPGMMKAQVDRIVNGETDPLKIRDNYTRDILGRDPIGKPNEKFAYSNGGYALLGHIAEVATGKPYEQLVKEMIFQPLGMTHSYTGFDTLPADRPSGHVRPDKDPKGAWQPENFTGPMEIMFAPAGGGMWCSAADLVKFGKMHMDGLNGKDGLLKAETIQRLHSGIPEDLIAESPSDIKMPYTAKPDSRLYACGWGIEADPGLEIMHTHNGSNGTMRAQLAIFPKSGVVVAAFVNCGGESEPSPPLQACLAIGQRFAKQ